MNIFIYTTVRLFKFDKPSAGYAATIGQKNTLSVMFLSLCSLVRSTFVPVVTRFSTSETKPWLLLQFSMFLLNVSLVIVELILDIVLVIVLEGTKSLGTKTLGCVWCFVTCVDLPKRRNRIIFYFKFLFSKDTSLCGF